MTRSRLSLSLLGACLLSSAIADAAFFDALEYRNVGPLRAGRVTAVAGTVKEPGTFYLGASGGGVWKTTDYGERWENVSDGYFASPSIGDIAVSQSDPNVIYVGTGSDGLRSNVIRGKGVYRSRTGGRSWEFVGLKETGHIGAVEIDPRDNNVVWVAAIGQAFAPNEERGVYRTRDGGETWDKVLEISDETGFADIELLPHNPDIVFAAAWKARRTPWDIISGGTQEEGGLFKSTNGGESWRRISEGLPTGLIGKIDLAVSAADSSVVYALVEAPGDDGGLYRSDDQGESFHQVSNKDYIRTRPFYYGNIEADPTDADTVYSIATRYYRSRDGGRHWEKLDPPHGDNHDMWINPEDPDLFIQANDGGANITHNGGETWSTQFNQPTAEVYTLHVDDQYPYWMYSGQQDNSSTIGVPSLPPRSVQNVHALLIETGGCETGPAVPKPGDADTIYANCKGRFGVYSKKTGLERQYYVGAANMYGQNPRDLKYRFQRVSPVAVSPHDPNTVYMGSQYLHRTSNSGVTWDTISPDLTAFEADKQVASGNPITRDITGEEFYSTLYAIAESEREPGVIWTGANDGPIHVTRDNGKTWNDVTPRGPRGGRVDSLDPSVHSDGVAYAAVHRYLLGDWKPYVYRAENYGQSWKLLTDGSNGIPADHPVRVVREDPERAGLLYAGTEYGVYVSFDDGANWTAFQQNLPVTPITDLQIHRDDLVLSTMGRAFWVLDKAAAALRQLEAADVAALPAEPRLLTPADTIRYRKVEIRNHDYPIPEYPEPGVVIDYVLPEGGAGSIALEVYNAAGELVNAYEGLPASGAGEVRVEENMAMNSITYIRKQGLTTHEGLNRFRWDMRARGAWHKDKDKRYADGPLLPPGDYELRLSVDGVEQRATASILVDPRSAQIGVSIADIEAQYGMRMQIRDLLDAARRKVAELEKEHSAEGLSEARSSAIEAVLGELNTAPGTYMPPGLVAQISYLYNMLKHADQAPGQEAIDRYAELQARYDELVATL
ncbi:MAG: hypothetical protein V2I82_05560 [Halieaceae bacterium]|jgi:photosystem II stability/assembly factor-like uncharacterized protein|nr:hypothetical protein [Halieaceae bacterium]